VVHLTFEGRRAGGTAGEVAAAYEAAAQSATATPGAQTPTPPTWGARHASTGEEASAVPEADHDGAASAANGEVADTKVVATKTAASKAALDKDGAEATDAADGASDGLHATRSLDLTGVTAEKSGGR